MKANFIFFDPRFRCIRSIGILLSTCRWYFHNYCICARATVVAAASENERKKMNLCHLFNCSLRLLRLLWAQYFSMRYRYTFTLLSTCVTSVMMTTDDVAGKKGWRRGLRKHTKYKKGFITTSLKLCHKL